MDDSVGAEIARQILDTMKKISNTYSGIMKEDPEFLENIIKNMPLRSLIIFGEGAIKEEMINEAIKRLNNK